MFPPETSAVLRHSGLEFVVGETLGLSVEMEGASPPPPPPLLLSLWVFSCCVLT